MNSNLKRRTTDSNGHFLFRANHGLSVSKDLKAILEEGRLDWNKVLEVGQGDGSLEQLPTDVIWEVGEDQLVWIRHEVILVQLVTHVLGCYLTSVI